MKQHHGMLPTPTAMKSLVTGVTTQAVLMVGLLGAVDDGVYAGKQYELWLSFSTAVPDRSGRYMDNTFRKYDVRPGQSFKVTRSAAKPSIQSPRTTVARSSTVTRGGFGKSVSSRSSFGG